MISVVVKNEFEEKDLGNVIPLYEEMVKLTVEEKGCVKYALYRDIANQGVLFLLEEWETKEDLDRHSASAHCQRLIPIINQYRIKKEMSLIEKIF